MFQQIDAIGRFVAFEQRDFSLAGLRFSFAVLAYVD